MQSEEIERIARLFVRVAEERPAVLTAIRDLLVAIAGPTQTETVVTTTVTTIVSPSAATTAGDAIPSSSEPIARSPASASDAAPAADATHDDATREDVTHEPATHEDATREDATHEDATFRPATHDDATSHATAVGATPAAPHPTASHGGATPRPPVVRVKVAPTEKDLASRDKLLQMFGGVGLGGGLGRVDSNGGAGFEARPPYACEAERAALVARLASAQARQLRRLRRDRAAARDFTPSAPLLLEHCVDDWVANRPEARTLDAAQLKIGERWYALTARAFTVLEEWFDGQPTATISDRQAAALKERLSAAALAQKGLHCWLARSVARSQRAIGVCGVQQHAFEEIRSWARHPGDGGFGIYLANGLRLDQDVQTEERSRIDRLLDQLELEHAPSHPAGDPTGRTHAAPADRAAAPDRFDSVADAFEAAREAFGGLLVFTDRAEESAERSPFVRPDEVYEVFETMHGIARDLATGALDGTPLDEVFVQRGHRKKPCAKSTMKRHHRFYHMEFEGRTVDLSEHITLGSRNQNTCLSIHWWHDESGGRFVIGHCGKHLPNTMS